MALCAPALAYPQDMIMESSLKGEIELGGAQKLRDADGGRSDLQVDDLRQEFVDVLKTRELFLTEGAILERIRRDSGIPLDRHVAHASLLYSEKGLLARKWGSARFTRLFEKRRIRFSWRLAFALSAAGN